MNMVESGTSVRSCFIVDCFCSSAVRPSKAFESGVNAIPLSVDLWVHYMDYVVDTYKEQDETQEGFVRSMFDRAIIACGSDFKSDKIWEAYLSWERNAERWSRVTYVYDRLLATPNSKYAQQWAKFQEHIKCRYANEVVSPEDLSALKRILRGDPLPEEGAEAPPGVEEAENADGTKVQEPLTEEDNKSLQQIILDTREKIHQKTTEEVKARWLYEDGIKRPYFHVKPLENVQLQSWRDYLEFEVKQTNETRSRILFERCLIACALYEEFWLRYIHYLETLESASEDEIRKVYERACTIHLREKMKLQLNWALFEEEKGKIEQAIKILNEIQTSFPDALEPKLQLISLERRQGNLTKVDQMFISAISSVQSSSDKITKTYTDLILRYARFIALVADDNNRAVSYLVEKIADVVTKETMTEEQQSHVETLYWALIDRAMATSPPNLSFVAEILQKCSKGIFSIKIRTNFAEKFATFVTECGPKGFSVSEAGRVLRQVRLELKNATQSEIGDGTDEAKKDESGKSSEKSQSATTNGNAAVTSYGSAGYSQSTNYPMQSPPMNGPPPSHPTSHPPPQGSYGGGYNQGYQQGYPQQQYQGWGYQGQQGYGYNQQNWGQGYSNYYGQR